MAARDHPSDSAVPSRLHRLLQLRELRGVGRWTADYVLLRGFGRLHVFPADDAGAQKSLAGWLGRRGALDYDGIHKAVEKWQPYAGMLCTSIFSSTAWRRLEPSNTVAVMRPRQRGDENDE